MPRSCDHLHHSAKWLISIFIALWLILIFTPSNANAQSTPKQEPKGSAISVEAPRTAAGERVFSAVQNSVLYIETQTAKSGSRNSSGTGWLATADGLAITNYHVVSSAVLEPKRFKLEYKLPGGKSTPLKLIAIDVIHDLAVVQLESVPSTANPLKLDTRVKTNIVPKGERLFSLGHPLDLGITIVEGTYNGYTDGSEEKQIHFSGAINAGMSGGPTVTQDLQVTGVNVAKHWRGELVSFLVPAPFAQALLDVAQQKLKSGKLVAPTREDVHTQLLAHQADWTTRMSKTPFGSWNIGRYSLPDTPGSWIRCTGGTNSTDEKTLHYKSDRRNCRAKDGIYVSDRVYVSGMSFSHSWMERGELGRMSFNQMYSSQFSGGDSDSFSVDFFGFGQREMTSRRCTENFVSIKDNASQLTTPLERVNAPKAETKPSVDATPKKPIELRAQLCATAYKRFPDLYEINLKVATIDSASQGVVSHLELEGVGYQQGIALAKQFMEAFQWKR